LKNKFEILRKTMILSIILIISLTSCNLPWRAKFEITITSIEDGQSVVLGQETRVVSFIQSSVGVEFVQLFVNGELSHTEYPPVGFPTEFTADQPWVPAVEGNTIISVIVTDAKGNISDPVNIAVQVVPSVSQVEATPTPTPTNTPEGLPLTQTAQAGCTNAASFVNHVTFPPNTNVSGGSNFTKVWQVNNNGTCDWIGYQIIHTSGDLLGANSPQALPVVSAGSNANISVDMVAPTTPGTYSGVWRIRTESGEIFGPELTITIVIPQPPTDTPVPTPTSTLTPTPTFTATTPAISVDQLFEVISISAGSTGNTTVNCPSGSVVVSGGFAGSSGVRIYHSMMDGNGWRVYGYNTSGSSKNMTVYATCLFNSGGTSSQVLEQENINANDITNIDVACPGGSVVTGGGWVIGSTTPVEIYNSTRSDNGWQIYVNNTGGDTPLVNAYAVCLSGVSGSTSQVFQSGVDVLAGSTAHGEKACPSGTYVTGGGFATDLGVIIYNTSLSDNGWQNYARNTTGSDKLMNTYTICYSP
jgi:hypothetical protein